MSASQGNATKNADFNAEDYPRSYLVDKKTRRILIGFGAILVSFGALMSALHAAGVAGTRFATGDVVVTILFAAFAIWLSFMVSRYVVLFEDRVELITWFTRRKLAREEILGRRMGNSTSKSRYGHFYILVPKDEQLAELRFPPLLDYDKYFWAWMRDIPQIKGR